ncbi:MAG: hypothetical protein R6U63_09265 [Longimicrobiales bacterium]
MGLRAALDAERDRQPGSRRGRAMRASTVFAPVLAVLLAGPLGAQQSATSTAVVQVPSISQLDVASHERLAAEAGEQAGVFRIRVRANHAWKVVVTAPVGIDGSVYVRATEHGPVEYRRLDPGAETVVASGGRGEVLVEVEYRREGDAAVIASAPLIYTLAALD